MKKFLAICLVLVIVLAIALPSMVLAGTTAGVNGSVPPVPALDSISTTSGTPHATGAGVVDVPETLTGSSFDTDSTAVVTVTISGTGVTATVVSVDSDTQITATFHLAAGPTTTSGVRHVYVHQSGQDSVDIVNFTVNGYISVTAPSSVDLGVMTYESTTNGQSASTGSVETNDTSNGILAKDLKGNAAGYMNTLATGLGTSLSHKFQVSKEGTTYAAADAGISYSDLANAGTFSFYVGQQVASPDIAGSYQITITFTGSAN